MNIFDYILLIIILINTVIGTVKGFIKEISGLVAVILGLIFSSMFYGEFAVIIKKLFTSPNIAKVISFILIFIIVVILVSILSNIIEKLLNKLLLGWVNNLSGLILGFSRGIIICGIILVLLSKYPVLGSNNLIYNSSFAPHILKFMKFLGTVSGLDFLDPKEISHIIDRFTHKLKTII